MPVIRLTAAASRATIPVSDPSGGLLLLPRLQFRCWLRLPGVTFPRDAIIDTGSPFSWFPEEVWQKLRPQIDYEWLPYPAGYAPPRGQTAGWNFSFRFARFLQPLALHDAQTELARDRVVVQFADGNPPIPRGSQRPAYVVVGLLGGLLEGTSLRVTADPNTGHPAGALEW